ncbi:PREDICTED: adhesion G-protein coupled receptor G2-like isoform X1 [Poecilia mexicana]|uniref:adhesion G-protein coupled receptor G2-like isoform X1 n=2 Tax=Poecilia mexicana TaxID=48701 RepID=UPI00072E40EA|nr:PREDICTED: adhesion G-protein coupled receptor G2-like isoform X1 [Poecilia mexicana]
MSSVSQTSYLMSPPESTSTSATDQDGLTTQNISTSSSSISLSSNKASNHTNDTNSSGSSSHNTLFTTSNSNRSASNKSYLTSPPSNESNSSGAKVQETFSTTPKFRTSSSSDSQTSSEASKMSKNITSSGTSDHNGLSTSPTFSSSSSSGPQTGHSKPTPTHNSTSSGAAQSLNSTTALNIHDVNSSFSRTSNVTSKPTNDRTSSGTGKPENTGTTTAFRTSSSSLSQPSYLTTQPTTSATTKSSPTTTASSTTTSSIILPSMTLDNNPNFNSEQLPQTESAENAANTMSKMSIIADLVRNTSTAIIKIGKTQGVFAKLTQQNEENKNFVFTSSGDVKILSESNNLATDYALSVHLPKEASEMAVKKNGSYIGILVFPGIPKINATSSFFNNQILGIEMGVNISNLSETINIQFTNVNTSGLSVSCVSWDGRSNQPDGAHKWITDGCKTIAVNSSVTCQCSHLTFFAILMSPGNKNISSSDLKTLTQITKAGCGISLFFLGVALFMHFLVRKNKASEAVKILMNLFVALFFLNLCFLVNESIAKLKVSAACVAMAAALHYSMLATFTWFFMQALHLYFNLHQISTDIKYYMYKICLSGWVIPALFVIGLLASNNYGNMEIYDDNGTSVSMCWITDSTLHMGVNIGYYGIVFIFTLTIFLVAVVQITKFASKADNRDKVSTKKRLFSLLGLFCLLGISWGFAFFSYGPLLLPSFYIFTILNSFQGFFLFVYYYFSSRIRPEDRKISENSSRATENVYTTSPYA